MGSKMSEDIEAIEKELEMELDRVSVSSFGTDDPDSEVSDEPSSDSETVSMQWAKTASAVQKYKKFKKHKEYEEHKSSVGIGKPIWWVNICTKISKSTKNTKSTKVVLTLESPFEWTFPWTHLTWGVLLKSHLGNIASWKM